MALELNGTTGASLVQDGVVVAADLNSALSDTIGKVKAWVNFNGIGTVAIRASYGVSSLTDIGTGLYTINLTTAMPDLNYARVVNKGESGGFFTSSFDNTNAPTTSAFTIGVRGGTGTYTDIGYIHASVFR